MDNDEATLKKQQEELKKKAEESKKIIFAMVEKGELPMPRPLTRGERKMADAQGKNPFKIIHGDKRSMMSIAEDAADFVCQLFPDFDFDALPNHIVKWWADYIFAISYRDDLSEKN